MANCCQHKDKTLGPQPLDTWASWAGRTTRPVAGYQLGIYKAFPPTPVTTGQAQPQSSSFQRRLGPNGVVACDMAWHNDREFRFHFGHSGQMKMLNVDSSMVALHELILLRTLTNTNIWIRGFKTKVVVQNHKQRTLAKLELYIRPLSLCWYTCRNQLCIP